jgi:isoleucyl-tRNA synthetase
MDNSYIESVWWALKEIAEKRLIYEGTRVLPYCPRCETPIANSEIAMDNSYKDITDISVYVKFELAEEQGTYFVAWTTTPWTLPANTALAVNSKAEYVRVKAVEKNGTEGVYIFAKERLAKLGDMFATHEVVSEHTGSEFVGFSYKPIFDYYVDSKLPHKENAWKVYAAEFVTLTEGTGIVHIAPGYGEEDMELAKENSIPVVIHVTPEGTFKPEVRDFAGLPVKPKSLPGKGTPAPKDGHQVTDIEIVKHLAHGGALLQKEKIIHSYPHCYRCETPLYYTALPAWFIKIQEVKPRLLELNQNIEWVPEHLKFGRFKKSMEGAPDWNISRSRFWASPLPIWKCEKCNNIEFISSVSDLSAKVRRGNSFFALRHGQSENLLTGITSSDNSVPVHLTEAGREMVRTAVNSEGGLKEKNISAIYASPLFRTKETAEIVAEELGFDPAKIIYDDRLKEIQTGEYNGKPGKEYHALFKNDFERFETAPEGGETMQQVKDRVGEFLYEVNGKHADDRILIISHEDPIWMMTSAATCMDIAETVGLKSGGKFMDPGTVRELGFERLPHNERFELDLHRPYIDSFTWACTCNLSAGQTGGELRRIPEVIDCWFESGSMPFAQAHFPFEKKEWFHENFPAQFVSEYIAQTRTWFYYMHAVSTILFDSNPFEHVVTTGNVLAEDGQKMSKSKNNFPDPWKTFDTYGVDAVRFYLLSSPLMRSEDLNFSEKGVDEVYKKIILRLSNVVSFYELYKEQGIGPSAESIHALDRWIISRLNELAAGVASGMESYELDKALKPVDLFIDDLSTWYLRRSRDRMKESGDDKHAAISTLRHVLMELAKLMAPFTPFIAEHVYTVAKGRGGLESVHLEEWPEGGDVDAPLIEQMATVRQIVEAALAVRAHAGVKVRQPLSELRYQVLAKRSGLTKELETLIAEELNVKSVSAGAIDKEPGAKIVSEEFLMYIESGGVRLALNVGITPELREEGLVRELIRSLQDLRKKAGLNPSDRIVLNVSTDEKGASFLAARESAILGTVLADAFQFGPPENGVEILLDGYSFTVRVEKA